MHQIKVLKSDSYLTGRKYRKFCTQVIKYYSFPALLKTKELQPPLDMGLAKSSQVSKNTGLQSIHLLTLKPNEFSRDLKSLMMENFIWTSEHKHFCYFPDFKNTMSQEEGKNIDLTLKWESLWQESYFFTPISSYKQSKMLNTKMTGGSVERSLH